MKLRAFTEEDRQAVIALWRACGLVRPQNDPNKDIDRKRRVNPELFIVGEISGEIVASVMAGYEGHRGWLNYLAVSPEARRSGLGREIVEYAEAKLLALGCPKVNLQVLTTNTEAISFYESVGYGNDNVLGLGKRLIPDN